MLKVEVTYSFNFPLNNSVHIRCQFVTSTLLPFFFKSFDVIFSVMQKPIQKPFHAYFLWELTGLYISGKTYQAFFKKNGSLYSGVQGKNNEHHIVDELQNSFIDALIFDLIDNVVFVVFALYSSILKIPGKLFLFFDERKSGEFTEN